jgi:hypothetical protein
MAEVPQTWHALLQLQEVVQESDETRPIENVMAINISNIW